MNEQNNQELNNKQPLIEDLTINEDQAAEVKGGPIYMRFDGIEGSVQQSQAQCQNNLKQLGLGAH
jgi:hypothetical protein